MRRGGIFGEGEELHEDARRIVPLVECRVRNNVCCMTDPDLTAGVLVTRRFPGYKDVTGVRYHYPKSKYQRSIEQLVGSLVLFYEPRRGGSSMSATTGGRSAFTSFAYIDSTRDDPDDPTHGYAELRYFMEFNTLVPGSATAIPLTSLQTAVKLIPFQQATHIVMMGISAPIHIGEVRAGLTDIGELAGIQQREFRDVVHNKAVRDASFRYRVVEHAYDGKCAFTGVRMTNGNGRAEADAAHIQAVSDGGPDSVRTGIALMKSLHWAFDRGLLSMTDDGSILTVDRGIDAPIRGLLASNGKAFLPRAEDLRPHPAFLQWHRNNRFKGLISPL